MNKKENSSPEIRRGCIPRLINIFDPRPGPSTRKLLSYQKRDSNRHSNTHGDGSSIRILRVSASAGHCDSEAPEDVKGRADETFSQQNNVNYHVKREISQEEQPSTDPRPNRDPPFVSLSQRLKWCQVLDELSRISQSADLSGYEEILQEIPRQRENEQPKSWKKRWGSKESKLLEKWKSVPAPKKHHSTGELLQKQKMKWLFPKKKRASAEEEIFDRIVVLKPATSMIHDLSRSKSSRAEVQERSNNNFSIKEVKKRFTHTLKNYKKDQRRRFLETLLPTIPNRYQKFTNSMKEKENNHFELEEAPSIISSTSTSDFPDEECEFKREATMHPDELMKELKDAPESSVGPSLGKLFSLSDEDFQNIPLPVEARERDSEASCSGGFSISERHEEQAVPDSPRTEIIEEDDSSPPPTPVPLEASQMMTSRQTSENIAEKPERRSPVSVLDPLFSEGECSPEQPPPAVECFQEVRHINFDEIEEAEGHISFLNDPKSQAEYVRRILCASDLMSSEASDKWNSSSPLVEPYLYDEVEYPSDEFPEDLRLLFDSTSEVLEAIKEKLFNCPFPAGEELLEIALKGINVNCATHTDERLEQITEKGLGAWMELRLQCQR